MTLKMRSYRIVVDLEFFTCPTNPYVGVEAKPPTMSKSTLDYQNNMCQSAFKNNESFESYVWGKDTYGKPHTTRP